MGKGKTKTVRTRSQTNKNNRTKGAQFERDVANYFREKFPDLEIHRGDQSFTARESDITGIPEVWIECQTSQAPDPEKKMRQAVEDMTSLGLDPHNWLAVVIFKRKGSKQMKAAIRAHQVSGELSPESLLISNLDCFFPVISNWARLGSR